MRFEAIADGSSFNGMEVNVEDWNLGKSRLLTINERLSSIKYRSSFYDLSLTLDFDKALEQFGTEVVTSNKNLDPALGGDPALSPYGIALPPYRPWKNGSINQDLIQADWTVQSNGNLAIGTPGVQAGLDDRQFDMTAISAAGLQAVAAMEEVRPATRHARNTQVGLLIKDDVGYAPYCAIDPLFSTTTGVSTYFGTLTGYPAPAHLTEGGVTQPGLLYTVGFTAQNNMAFHVTWISVEGDMYQVQATNDLVVWTPVSPQLVGIGGNMTFTVLVGMPYTFFRVYDLTGQTRAVVVDYGFSPGAQGLVNESSPFNPNWVKIVSQDQLIQGTYSYDNSTWQFKFPTGINPGVIINLLANFKPMSTEVVRSEPGGVTQATVVAFTADGGLYGVNQQSVANMIRGWNVDAFLHGGDNSYYDGEIGDFRRNIQNWQDFIDARKFFACPGNHDYFNAATPAQPTLGYDLSTETNYFTYWPGNGRYYDVVIGNIHLFALNASYNSSDTPVYADTDTSPPGDRDANWCESPYTPVGSGSSRTIHLVAGQTYTVHVDPNYGDKSTFLVDSYVVYGAATCRDGQAFTVTPSLLTAVAFGEPTLDPSPVDPFLRTGRGFRVIADAVNGGLAAVTVSGSAATFDTPGFLAGNATDVGKAIRLTTGSKKVYIIALAGDATHCTVSPAAPAPDSGQFQISPNYVVSSATPISPVQTYFGGDIVQQNWAVANLFTVTVTGKVRLDRINSAMAEWLKQGLTRSQSPWKVVMFHQPNEFSASWTGGHPRGMYPRMEWPYAAWGADLILNGHQHNYERSKRDGVVRIICGIGGENNTVINDNAYASPYTLAKYNHSAASGATTDYGALKLTATATSLAGELHTIGGANPDNFTFTKTACVEASQDRPEDQLDEPCIELSDENPWRRDLVLGGELVEYDTYNPPEPDLSTVNLGESVAVTSQTGAQYDVYVVTHRSQPPSWRIEPRTLNEYVPGQMAIAYSGNLADLATINPRAKEVRPRRTMSQTTTDGIHPINHGWYDNVDDLDQSMQAGWQLYHFGLVQGVLVADPVKFFGPHHRQGLALWYPFNEHPDDARLVADHSSTEVDPEVVGLSPDDRHFDASQGAYLTAQPQIQVLDADGNPTGFTGGLQITDTQDRLLTDSQAFAAGFWFRPYTQPFSTGPDTVTMGPVNLEFYSGASPHAASLSLNFDQARWLSFTQLDSIWYYLAWSYTGDVFIEGDGPDRMVWGNFTYYLWRSNGTPISNTVETVRDDTTRLNRPITINGAAGPLDIRDFRVWNISKTIAELELARYHVPNPTAVLYRPAWLESANDGDRYGVKVMDSGWVMAEKLPSAIKTPDQAWVQRYDYMGLYDAQDRYKQVGIGSGNAPPATIRTLGLQWDTLRASGTAAVSTQIGQFLGLNQYWLNENVPDGYYSLNPANITAAGTGINPMVRHTTISNPWPNPPLATNPTRDRLWIKGDNQDGVTTQVTGLVYEVVLARDTSTMGFKLVATPVPVWEEGYQPTGAGVELTSAAFGNRLAVSNAGQVYAGPYSGIITSAPLYMYLNEEASEEKSGNEAFKAWVNPNSLGLENGVAALPESGNISFQSTAVLNPGYYRLELTSGNIGQVDPSFNGYHVLVTVGDVPIEAVLCHGLTGSDFESADSLDFTVERPISGTWLLSIDWFNSFRDETRGQARQLKVSGYKITLLHSTLCQITLKSGGFDIVAQSTSSMSYPATAGGWLQNISHFGTVTRYQHESNLYSINDTVTSREPMSNQLAATTMERREDIILLASYPLPDHAPPPLPVYGAITPFTGITMNGESHE
jgi:hypothetical protein